MCRVLELCLILCTIPLLEASSINFSGLINLGKSWNYEYRVFRTNDKHKHTQGHEKADRIERGDNILRKVQERARENVQNTVDQADERQDTRERDKDTKNSTKKLKNGKEKKSLNKIEDNGSSGVESSLNTDSGYESKLEVSHESTKKVLKQRSKSETKKYSIYSRSKRNKAKVSVKDDSSDSSLNGTTEDDSSDNSDSKPIPNIINYNIQRTAPEKLSLLTGNKPKLAKELSKTKSAVHRGKTSKEVKKSATKGGKTKKKPLRVFNLTEIVNNIPGIPFYQNISKLVQAHLVKDDEKLTEFTNNLRNETLQVFNFVKRNTNQNHIKSLVKKLARSYDAKFKEFLRDTGDYKIKTRLGTQKAVLNTIDTSNIILRRLLNFWMKELDDEGILRHNSDTAQVFKKAVEQQEEKNLELACKNLNICRSKSSFSTFLIGILDILMECKDGKFKQAVDAFTEEAKGEITPINALSDNTKSELNYQIKSIENMDIELLRLLINQFKNTIININKPISNSLRYCFRTINEAMLAVMDIFDKTIIGVPENVSEWTKLTDDFRDFKDDKRDDVQSIASNFVGHIKKNLATLDSASVGDLEKNLSGLLAECDESDWNRINTFLETQ